ncbi:MAG: DUF3524 domain-containing protein [Gammaproteobacteria bacterium]|nr:MAG: DUF3524 domain-containing protein [Gammaproteobacteria bacterium]
MSGQPQAWLLSAYAAPSHRAWAERVLALLPGFTWQRFELPGRHFSWRIRGNPLSWLDVLPESSPDLMVATSMVDLATLKGLHPALAGVPTLYYFHENQFAYPASSDQVPSLEPQMVQLYGALAAHRVKFNSAYNRDAFLSGVEALLARLPDAVPAGVTARIAARSSVLPVPVEAVAPGEQDPRLIVWNHRWEYDKAPEVFADAVLALAATGRDFQLALLGARGRIPHPALARLRSALGAQIVADGELPRAAYMALLGRAGIVVSTARHEFQGLAVLEAVSAGARPLVPDALCYPEQYPEPYRYAADDAQALAGRLEHWLCDGLPPPVDVSAWYGKALAPRWQTALQALL